MAIWRGAKVLVLGDPLPGFATCATEPPRRPAHPQAPECLVRLGIAAALGLGVIDRERPAGGEHEAGEEREPAPENESARAPPRPFGRLHHRDGRSAYGPFGPGGRRGPARETELTDQVDDPTVDLLRQRRPFGAGLDGDRAGRPLDRA